MSAGHKAKQNEVMLPVLCKSHGRSIRMNFKFRILNLVLYNIFIIALEVTINSLLIKYAGIRKPGGMAVMRGKHLYGAGWIT